MALPCDTAELLRHKEEKKQGKRKKKKIEERKKEKEKEKGRKEKGKKGEREKGEKILMPFSLPFLLASHCYFFLFLLKRPD